MAETFERCVGCGIEAREHPIIGIGDRVDGQWVPMPVCKACHEDPAHRVHPIKAHFFPRAEAPYALTVAGSPNIGG